MFDNRCACTDIPLLVRTDVRAYVRTYLRQIRTDARTLSNTPIQLPLLSFLPVHDSSTMLQVLIEGSGGKHFWNRRDEFCDVFHKAIVVDRASPARCTNAKDASALVEGEAEPGLDTEPAQRGSQVYGLRVSLRRDDEELFLCGREHDDVGPLCMLQHSRPVRGLSESLPVLNAARAELVNLAHLDEKIPR